jgi:ketosteroid isomerase-like protein
MPASRRAVSQPHRTRSAYWLRRDTGLVDRESLDFWEWFYEPAVDQSVPIEERWHEDLVVNQSPDMLDTEGTFHGYEGLRTVNRELQESWENIRWRPHEVHRLDGDRYLVLLMVSTQGRGSGIELESQVGHIVTFRGEKAARLDTHIGWDEARRAAGLSE